MGFFRGNRFGIEFGRKSEKSGSAKNAVKTGQDSGENYGFRRRTII